MQVFWNALTLCKIYVFHLDIFRIGYFTLKRDIDPDKIHLALFSKQDSPHIHEKTPTYR